MIRKNVVPLCVETAKQTNELNVKTVNLRDISKWFWDIAKYVMTAIIISSFLGGYKDDTTTLYLMSILVALVLMAIGTIFYWISKKKK